MSKPLPDFTGRAVVVYVEGGAYTFVAPRFEQIAGRLFLVGEHVAVGDEPHWSRGAETYQPWDAVKALLVFPSLEQLRAQTAARPPVPDAPPKGWFRRP
jgi:hypothetical protein